MVDANLLIVAFGIAGGALAGSWSYFNGKAGEYKRCIKMMEDDVSSLEKEVRFLRRNIDEMRSSYLNLKSAYTELLKREPSKVEVTIDEDIKEAIKFAMKNSHPDKPAGSQEQFIKFYELYKVYCKDK